MVSINVPILNAMDDLGLTDHNKYKFMFLNWATRASKKISSYYQYERKIKVLTVCGCVAELPSDAHTLEIAVLGDWGCDCGDLFTRVYSCLGLGNVSVTASIDSTGFLVVDLPPEFTSPANSLTTYSLNYISYHVQNNQVILDRNCDAQNLTVQYLGLITDDNGFIKINENHTEAIVEYCMWKFRGRRIRSGTDLGLARDHEKRWHQLAAEARGDDAQPSDSDQQKIADMLHNPLSGRGLNLVSSWVNL